MVQRREHMVKGVIAEVRKDQKVGSGDFFSIHNGVQLTNSPIIVICWSKIIFFKFYLKNFIYIYLGWSPSWKVSGWWWPAWSPTKNTWVLPTMTIKFHIMNVPNSVWPLNMYMKRGRMKGIRSVFFTWFLRPWINSKTLKEYIKYICQNFFKYVTYLSTKALWKPNIHTNGATSHCRYFFTGSFWTGK